MSVVEQTKVDRMRLRLFRANPHCFWCGIKVTLERKDIATLATVDHLYSRWHPERISRHMAGEGVLHVLACHGCNQERAGAESQQVPFVPKLSERLEFAQRADAALAQRRRFQRRKTEQESATQVKRHSAKVRTLKEEYEQEVKRPMMRIICTLEEAIEFAKENPAR